MEALPTFVAHKQVLLQIIWTKASQR